MNDEAKEKLGPRAAAYRAANPETVRTRDASCTVRIRAADRAQDQSGQFIAMIKNFAAVAKTADRRPKT